MALSARQLPTDYSPTGRYRVSFNFQWGPAPLCSSKVVEAVSRQAAVDSVAGGTGAEVLRWAEADRPEREALLLQVWADSDAHRAELDKRYGLNRR